MESLIGATVVDALREMLSNNSERLETVVFAEIPSSSPLIQQRGPLSPNALDIIARALRLRGDTSLPFWDAAMLMCFGSCEGARDILEGALYHAPRPSRDWQMSISECTATNIRRLSPDGRGHTVLALLSSVIESSGRRAHFPMLDFHLPANRINEQVAIDALRALEAGPGYLLMSGKSYHFIGTRVIDDAAFLRFLARSLLLSPVIDRSWIAHQMLEGRCALRITPRGRQDDAPRIIAIIDTTVSRVSR